MNDIGVSVVIITLNNGDTIQKTLDSVKWADEIVIVDSGSKDATIQICESFNCKIFYREFDNYSAQKRYAVSKAKSKWLLSIDGDEALDIKLIEEIKNNILSVDDKTGGFDIPIGNYFHQRLIKHGGWFPDYHLRLFNREKGGFNDYIVHEGVKVEGRIIKLKNMIHHYCYLDIVKYMDKINRYSSMTAKGIYENPKRKRYLTTSANLLLRPFFTFILRYFIKGGFLDGKEGLMLNLFHSYYVFSKYAKVWEMEYREKRGEK